MALFSLRQSESRGDFSKQAVDALSFSIWHDFSPPTERGRRCLISPEAVDLTVKLSCQSLRQVSTIYTGRLARVWEPHPYSHFKAVNTLFGYLAYQFFPS